MNPKEYSFKEINYKYGVVSQKWEFVFGDRTFLTNCPGGKDIARKVAGAISGGLKRTKSNEIDSLARGQINKLTMA